MSLFRTETIIVSLLEKLRQHGSWCGETHIQKAVFMLQKLFEVPAISFEFVLYKHGPFSFDLRDKLTEMRADGLIDVRVMPAPYGPSLVPTERGKVLLKAYTKVMKAQEPAIDFVAAKLGDKRVEQLERLATALYVIESEPSLKKDKRAVAKRIIELKPHIEFDKALEAKELIDQLMNERV